MHSQEPLISEVIVLLFDLAQSVYLEVEEVEQIEVCIKKLRSIIIE